MTPKEKADELFNKMKGFRVKHTHSKKCALIAVEEILRLMDNVAGIEGNNFRGTETNGYVTAQTEEEYWLNVKIELNK